MFTTPTFNNLQIALIIFVAFGLVAVIRGVMLRNQAAKSNVNEYAKMLKGLTR